MWDRIHTDSEKPLCDGRTHVGELLEGHISQMMDRGVGKYRPYAEVLKEMAKFRGNFGSTGTVLSLISHSLTKWPVKIMIKDSQGEQKKLLLTWMWGCG